MVNYFSKSVMMEMKWMEMVAPQLVQLKKIISVGMDLNKRLLIVLI